MAAESQHTVGHTQPTVNRWSPVFIPNDSQRNWFFLIRLAESIPGVNTFYNFWLDDEQPPTTGAIKDILSCLATVDTLLIGVMASFVSAINFDELTEHNLRFSKQVIFSYCVTFCVVKYTYFSTANCSLIISTLHSVYVDHRVFNITKTLQAMSRILDSNTINLLALFSVLRALKITTPP